MQILFVSAYVPSPIRVRPYQFIRALARLGHRITLVCGAGREDAATLDELRGVCARVVPVAISKADMALGALRALPGGTPLQAAISASPRLRAAVRAEAASGRHDIAHIEHLRASALGAELRPLPTVLDSVDSISLLFERTLRGSPSLKSRAMALIDLDRTREYEARYLDRFDRVLVSSPEDAGALAKLRTERALPDRGEVAVVPNGVDLAYFAPGAYPQEPETLVFSGKMSYHANEAAALFLAREIMPLVWQRKPAVRLTIAGSAPTGAVQALASDARVRVTGFLPDLRPAIGGAAVAVCPLRYGVGIQNKALEAMALGVPLVAARQIARSISACDGEDLVLAERAEEYAQAILRLLDDPARAATLGAAGRRYVERHHSWDAAARQLEELYEAASARVAAGAV